MTVTVDWAPVDRGVAQLVDGVEAGSRRAALEEAARTASDIRARTPVRTGTLIATIGVTGEADAAGVTYGGGLRYARIVAARTGNVTDAAADAERRFHDAETAMAAREVHRL